MNALIVAYHAHPALWILGAYYVFSSAVGSMPMPDTSSSKGYNWLFGFLNTLAANVTRALASRLPKDATPPAPKP